MTISIFNLFTIGIGPSSSHTTGPMRAARQYLVQVDNIGLLSKASRIKVDLYGSLALTGKGHSTDIAIMLGLEGEVPSGIDPADIHGRISGIRQNHKINLLKKYERPFDPEKEIVFHMDRFLPYHPNGMKFSLYDDTGKELHSEIFYSVGGGFIVNHTEASKDKHLGDTTHQVPYHFSTGDELLRIGREHQLTIPEIVRLNELSWQPQEEINTGLMQIWRVMQACVVRGCQQEGVLPGGLNVKRRAPNLLRSLCDKSEKRDPAEIMKWLSLWALAVNEENAAGGRVVTAPTNGSAGIIPSVLHYYHQFIDGATDKGIIDFFLTAGAIGILYKEGASISGAEMGCMGEVGVACSMAAAGLTAALGGSNEQIENAAEIGMEHNLGLTCDPIKGLVQIPCIERNTMGAIKAVNAALLALEGDGSHRVSLDQVIATMRQTGTDMQSIYKETSLGGLAVNVPEC